MDQQGFQQPPTRLRPAPFWAINDTLDPEKTAAQMRDMRRVGLSGAFFHSRHGLITEYLGDEWFAAMDAALAAARETDGYLWLYDEDLWPSGNAGGQVAGMKPEWRAALLVGMLLPPGAPLPSPREDHELLFAYVLHERSGAVLTRYERVHRRNLLDYTDTERLLLVRVYQPKTGWWGGESYCNLLDPDAVQQFVRMTHEVYRQRYGAEFGKRIPGIFTDEPQLAHDPCGIAWYDRLPERYLEWTGRDLVQDLPMLYFDGAEARAIRIQIYRCILRQFLEAFSRPIYEWCSQHGIEHTGHFNSEDSLTGQVENHCGGVMAHYRYQHTPGIDHLCRQTDPMLLTVKQAASAARQLGRPQVLTEIFGVSRHTNTFEQFRWIGHYNLVLGATFFVPHLTWYSAHGRRKRDYPPVWNYQQTYWDDLYPLNTYFTRIAHALCCGQPECDILVLHPVENAAAGRRLGVRVRGQEDEGAVRMPADPPAATQAEGELIDRMLRLTLDSILTAGYEADLGDEGYLADMGDVESGCLCVGRMRYPLVVIPPSVTWRPSTLDLLERFVEQGGHLLVAGPDPRELDGRPAEAEWQTLLQHPHVVRVPAAAEAIRRAVEQMAPQDFRLRDPDGRPLSRVYLHHRLDGDQHILFIANNDPDAPRDAVLDVQGWSGPALWWDPLTGEARQIPETTCGTGRRFQFRLDPAGSVLLTVGGARVEVIHEWPTSPPADARVTPIHGPFDFRRLQPNVLVIDRMAVSVDGGAHFEPENLDFRVRRWLASLFGTTPALQWQPWVSLKKGLFAGKGGDIVLRYRFFSQITAPRCELVIENMQHGRVTVNGQSVSLTTTGWFWDQDFRTVAIGELVQSGWNEVDFAVSYDFLTDVEPAYLIGDFGVALAPDGRSGMVIAEPERLHTGSWGRQGYPFYSGRICYRTIFEATHGRPVWLRLSDVSATLVKLRVNQMEQPPLLWRPWLVDLSQCVTTGPNELEIEVVSSLQNSWGPLHEMQGDDNLWCGPNAFDQESILHERLNVFDYGLFGVELIYGDE